MLFRKITTILFSPPSVSSHSLISSNTSSVQFPSLLPQIKKKVFESESIQVRPIHCVRLMCLILSHPLLKKLAGEPLAFPTVDCASPGWHLKVHLSPVFSVKCYLVVRIAAWSHSDVMFWTRLGAILLSGLTVSLFVMWVAMDGNCQNPLIC